MTTDSISETTSDGSRAASGVSFGDSRTFRWLGAAFLLRAIGSAVSGLLLAPVYLLASAVPVDMAATMADIADNQWQLRASIVGELVTAGSIVALGVLLFTVLRRRRGIGGARCRRPALHLPTQPAVRARWRTLACPASEPFTHG